MPIRILLRDQNAEARMIGQVRGLTEGVRALLDEGPVEVVVYHARRSRFAGRDRPPNPDRLPPGVPGVVSVELLVRNSRLICLVHQQAGRWIGREEPAPRR